MEIEVIQMWKCASGLHAFRMQGDPARYCPICSFDRHVNVELGRVENPTPEDEVLADETIKRMAPGLAERKPGLKS